MNTAGQSIRHERHTVRWCGACGSPSCQNASQEWLAGWRHRDHTRFHAHDARLLLYRRAARPTQPVTPHRHRLGCVTTVPPVCIRVLCVWHGVLRACAYACSCVCGCRRCVVVRPLHLHSPLPLTSHCCHTTTTVAATRCCPTTATVGWSLLPRRQPVVLAAGTSTPHQRPPTHQPSGGSTPTAAAGGAAVTPTPSVTTTTHRRQGQCCCYVRTCVKNLAQSGRGKRMAGVGWGVVRTAAAIPPPPLVVSRRCSCLPTSLHSLHLLERATHTHFRCSRRVDSVSDNSSRWDTKLPNHSCGSSPSRVPLSVPPQLWGTSCRILRRRVRQAGGRSGG